MCYSLAVFLLAISCVTSFPVLFLTYEDGQGSHSNPRLLNCVSPVPFLNAAVNSMSYRCRPSTKTPESLGLKSKDLPLLEILEEPMNDITAVEISEEIVVPDAPSSTLFEASVVAVDTKEEQIAQEKDKYEVVPEPRTARRKPGNCPDGEMYLSELDLCMPYTPHVVETKPEVSPFNAPASPVASINPEFKITKVGYAPIRCKEGEIHSPSIGICVPIDNCWPHPDCSHHGKDKNKDKGKNKTKKVVNDEEEDD